MLFYSFFEIMNVSIRADLMLLLYGDKKVLISLIFPTMDHYITHHPEEKPLYKLLYV